ncbi:MAG: phasin family protein [Bacteroidota bacterium]
MAIQNEAPLTALAKRQVEAVQSTTADARELAHKIVLAGLGVLSIAEEEGTKLFKQMTDKGAAFDLTLPGRETAQTAVTALQEQASQFATALLERRDEVIFVAGETSKKVEHNVQDAVTTAMRRLGVPTRREITELTQSVERLAANIEQLRNQRAGGASGGSSSGVSAKHLGGGWYEIRVGGAVLKKVQGKDEAAKAVAELKA